VKKTLIALLFVAMGATLSAAPILDFGVVAPTGGSISYAGGAAALVGSDIDVDNVVGIGTPLSDGVMIDLKGAKLNFTTGGLTAFSDGTFTFAGGGTISIVIAQEPNSDAKGTEVVILAGTFTGASVTSFGGTFKIAGASFLDRKNPELLAIYGLPEQVYTGNFNISFNAPTSIDGFRSSVVLSGDITNTPVPEPITVLLVGTGLVGLGFASRKRMAA
jgi:hypothetical protein